jgi:hypothetical protein
LAAHLWRWYQRQQVSKPLSFIFFGYHNVRWRPQYDRYTIATINNTWTSYQLEIAYNYAGYDKTLNCYVPCIVSKEETGPPSRVASNI